MSLFSAFSIVIMDLRNILQTALLSGSNITALAVLSAMASLTLITTTLLFQKSYCFTVGYGASVAIMASAMVLVLDGGGGSVQDDTATQTTSASFWSSQSLLVYAALLYGVRLSVFLAWRQRRVKFIGKQTQSFDETCTPAKAVLLSVCLGVLYACMVSPVLFVLRNTDPTGASTASWTASTWYLSYGVELLMSYGGLLLEAVADQHKFYVKQRHQSDYGDLRFVGPTHGLYGLCRHPNFFGEILFWTGIWLAGVSSHSFGDSLSAWVAGTLGWITICFIMKDSAARLDQKQEKNYQGSKHYQEWKQRVRGSLLPIPSILYRM